MKSTELKETNRTETKRSKHCFRRTEIYHQWLHDDNYVYTNQRYNVAGHYDLLFAGTLNSNATRQDIVDSWTGWHSESCIAVINRDKKLILVSLKYALHSSELLNDVPSDYQVFLTEDEIPNPNILSTGELDEVIKIHASFLVKRFVETTLGELYLLLKRRIKILHVDPETIFKHSKDWIKNAWHKSGYSYGIAHNYRIIVYDDIVAFVDRYKVKKYDWYKKPVEGYGYIERWTNWSNKEYLRVDLPSIKQIVTNQVFTSKEKLQLAQSYFYGKYCHGYGISRKELSAKWTAPYDREELETRFKKANIQVNLENHSNLSLWTDGIKLYHKVLVANDEAYVKRCIKQSDKNRQEAYAKLIKESNTELLESFRKFVPYILRKKVEYQRYYRSFKKGSLGSWKTDYVYFNNTFANTYLRLRGETIETSRHATVPLKDAVEMWKLYKSIVNKHHWVENTDYVVRFDTKHINVGKYNLRAIIYSKKKTDQGIVLDKYEWCVVIGCHYLWIDDFMDFIKYYNLYTIFDIDTPPS